MKNSTNSITLDTPKMDKLTRISSPLTDESLSKYSCSSIEWEDVNSSPDIIEISLYELYSLHSEIQKLIKLSESSLKNKGGIKIGPYLFTLIVKKQEELVYTPKEFIINQLANVQVPEYEDFIPEFEEYSLTKIANSEPSIHPEVKFIRRIKKEQEHLRDNLQWEYAELATLKQDLKKQETELNRKTENLSKEVFLINQKFIENDRNKAVYDQFEEELDMERSRYKQLVVQTIDDLFKIIYDNHFSKIGNHQASRIEEKLNTLLRSL